MAFDNYTLRTAQNIVTSRTDAQAVINLDYYNGDHWRDADGWVGPRPQMNEAAYSTTMQAIRDAFVMRNVVRELVGRHVSGVVGRELQWGFTVKRPLGEIETTDENGQTQSEDEQPTEAENALIDEAEAALTEWWDNREIPEILQQAMGAALNTKRAVLRLYVPPGMRDEAGNLRRGDLTTTLNYVWPQHLGTNEDTLELQFPSATVYTDKLTRRDIGLFTYRATLPDAVETFQTAENGPERAELTYLADDGQTVLRVLESGGDVEEPLLLPLGGRLTMYEMKRDWLITPQIISQQKLLNMAQSMKARNTVQGGFLERIFLNVKWPGTTDGNGVFTPTPLAVGAGTLNSLQGETYEDRDGTTHVLNPSVVYRDPVDPETFLATEQSAYLAMLQEAQQLHYALAGDSVVSGESRKQAREAFEADLLKSAGKVEAAGRWLLETALAMAAYFAGQPGRFDGLRAYVQCRINAGPITPDDMRVAGEMVDKGLWSVETAMSKTGIEDVGAEKDRIEKERAESQNSEAAGLALAQQALDSMRALQPATTPTATVAQQQQEGDQVVA